MAARSKSKDFGSVVGWCVSSELNRCHLALLKAHVCGISAASRGFGDGQTLSCTVVYVY